VHAIVVFFTSRSQNVKVSNGNSALHNLKNKRGNRLMRANASKHWHSSIKFYFVCFLNYRSLSQKNKKLLLLGVLRLNIGLQQVWLDVRPMGIYNAFGL
jgi:hypothetical protein